MCTVIFPLLCDAKLAQLLSPSTSGTLLWPHELIRPNPSSIPHPRDGFIPNPYGRMDQSGKQDKRSRKPNSNSRRGTSAPGAGARARGPGAGAPVVASPVTGARAGDPGAGAPAAASLATGASAGGPGASGPPAAWWPAAFVGGSFTVDSCPCSSEWLYPTGGFMNCLQRPQTSPLFPQPYPFVNYPNASHLPKSFHFVGAPSSRGTPSPLGSGFAMDAADAQIGSQEKETIDIDDDDTLEPVRTD
ncbi:hypothetical protein E2562_017174 [Oryza meyeriana var. granulata]|uniref:Uncharacterized protein n=1 Tax=Oryza meyeriana var. granulata TaxID=110450 RepID=A0A6G1ELY7_9ORYZ|nr:hypothetical protein E2562_017174 [Oryza meyeriana var. granulata]KAF0925565.1 hypothetical protein E2562_017174 [Oryza meyeriana var. granulata]KAF0925566.1 hypothetical protein E2562_017174 [Oryza meyeriana var. granulata]KAF0925567.1 hypothetical protein E2562_017174 [Oryza meyeriana var. granulata]KAF0925568.1 hypothetical protein E2562_017174 [Oryza meyeriana var. granulata]